MLHRHDQALRLNCAVHVRNDMPVGLMAICSHLR